MQLGYKINDYENAIRQQLIMKWCASMPEQIKKAWYINI